MSDEKENEHENDVRIRRSIEAVWRVESSRLLGGLVRKVRDLDRAEDLAQAALVKALEVWASSGIPSNPGAWLMTAATNLARDGFRRDKMVERKHEEIRLEAPDDGGPFEDDVLRLMAIACHPVLSKDARVVMTLRLVGGLTTAEIAKASFTPEPTIAQRIVRAKRTIAEAKVPFETPDEDAFAERVASIVDVVYLVFNEGYVGSSGDRWVRYELCDEALRLGRILAARVHSDAEVLGLLALMELQGSRLRARTGPGGEPVTLLEQNRATWDFGMIRRGLDALARAERLGAEPGPYVLQASIAACHARARTAADTDWERIVACYDALLERTGSPVVALNRAVAIGMARGAEVALPLVEALAADPTLEGYHHVATARGDLLFKLGRFHEARDAFERAASMTDNVQERVLLARRATESMQKAAVR